MDILFADLDAFVETNSFGATLVGPSLLHGLLHDVFSACECSPPSPLKFVMDCSETLAFL